MALPINDLEQLEEYIKANLVQWLTEQSFGKPPVVYEIELRERMVRVEEELRHQRELMLKGFEAADKQQQALREDMNKRFEAVDKRFEAVDKRFEAMDKRFESVQQQMDKRFEDMNKRFDEMVRRQDLHFRWVIGFIGTGVGLVIAAMRFL